MAKKKNKTKEIGKTIIRNRKARHNYFIVKTLEAGIVLLGTEVKSLRQGKANLQDAYARIKDGEIFLYGLHISPYEQANRFNHEPRRIRKLLLHNYEIRRLIRQVEEKGITLIPIRLYFNDNGHVKVEVALARGKRLYDKRETIKKSDIQREIERSIKDRD